MLTWFLFISPTKIIVVLSCVLLVSPSFGLGRLVYRSMVMKQNSVHLVNGPPIELMTRPSAKPFPFLSQSRLRYLAIIRHLHLRSRYLKFLMGHLFTLP